MHDYLVQRGLSPAEVTAVWIGLMAVAGAASWLFLRWIITGPVSPDPWDDEVAAELERDDCPQICHRCFTAHDSSLHFCSHCGAMVGPHTSLIPPLYLYPISDVFRAGAEGRYRRSPVLILGYFIAAFGYAFWLPFPVGLVVLFVYWNKLWRNVPASRTPEGGAP